jgi:hypothetical protein
MLTTGRKFEDYHQLRTPADFDPVIEHIGDVKCDEPILTTMKVFELKTV